MNTLRRSEYLLKKNQFESKSTKRDEKAMNLDSSDKIK